MGEEAFGRAMHFNEHENTLLEAFAKLVIPFQSDIIAAILKPLNGVELYPNCGLTVFQSPLPSFSQNHS